MKKKMRWENRYWVLVGIGVALVFMFFFAISVPQQFIGEQYQVTEKGATYEDCVKGALDTNLGVCVVENGSKVVVGDCQLWTNSQGRLRYRFWAEPRHHGCDASYVSDGRINMVALSLKVDYCPSNSLSYVQMNKLGACAVVLKPTPTPAVQNKTPAPTLPVVAVCNASVVCLDASTIKYTGNDCSTINVVCASGTECKSGSCFAIPPVTTPAPADLCKGVVCKDGCTVDYTLESQGSCDSKTGSCVYAVVSKMDSKCLPDGVSGQTLTGAVASVPPMNATNPTFFQKYGIFIVGGVLVVLLVVYINMTMKKKGRR